MTDSAHHYFERFSGVWSKHYSHGGTMGGRVTRFLAALADGTPAPAMALDFGCGSGQIALGMADAGYTVTGVDIAEGMIEQARTNDAKGLVDWRVMGAGQAFPVGDGILDAVVSSSVLEYIPDPAPLIGEFARVLRPGGRLLFTVPDPRHPIRRREARMARLSRCDLAYRLLRLTRWEPVHTYLRISCTRWDYEAWGRALMAAGFQVAQAPECDDPLMMVEACRLP